MRPTHTGENWFPLFSLLIRLFLFSSSSLCIPKHCQVNTQNSLSHCQNILLIIKIIKKLQSPSMVLTFSKSQISKAFMITLQAHWTLSPGTPLWMHPMPDHRPLPVTTCAKGLPLTCQNRHGLEAFLILCPLPDTPSTLLWNPGASVYSDLSITMISLA